MRINQFNYSGQVSRQTSEVKTWFREETIHAEYNISICDETESGPAACIVSCQIVHQIQLGVV